MSLLQVLGTVLAIPVGIGSAYTMYKSNFTAEASCQALRANIIQILDKSVDAGARHMLVRRDVEAFEKTCGGVDPDAAAAFKGLLASDKTSVAAVPRRVEVPSKAAEVKAAEAKPVEAKSVQAKPVERKIETKIEAKAEVAAKPIAKPAAPMAAVAVATPPRDAVKSDTEWLDAVRGALKAPPADAEPAVETRVETKAADAKPADVKPAEAKAEEAKTAIAAPLVRQAVREAPPMSIENVRTPPLMTVLAPSLPAPSAVGNVPEPREEARTEPRLETVRADDHPVPPSAIPDPPTDITPPEERSRIGQLISEIPFAKRLLDK
ncbi:MAG TPA: hypothetical protein VGM57_12045 [Pseudolabrys sp.]